MSVGRRDVRIWKPDAKGQFSVKSFYNALTGVNSWIVGWKRIWDPSVPPRVLVLCWVASLNKILTMDQLKRRNYAIVNGCPFCLQDEETINHVLIHCSYALKVWSSILQLFDMCWVMPSSIKE